MLAITAGSLLLSALVVVLNTDKKVSVDLLEKIREVRVSNTRAGVALSALQESEHTNLVHADNSDSIERLTLRLLEALSSNAIKNVLSVERSSVYRTDRTNRFANEYSKPLHSLSVSISANAKEADALLVVLHQLSNAAQWRPIELRSCSFRKRSQRIVVAFSCVIDVYIFPENEVRSSE